MLSLGLGPEVLKEFHNELRSPKRAVRARAQMLNKEEKFISTAPLEVLSGEIAHDWDGHKEEVVSTAQLTILDPNNHFDVDIHATSDSRMWFNKLIQIWYDVWLPTRDQWVEVPVFRGWIVEVARRGIEVDIDLTGKETYHIPPASFQERYVRKKHERYGYAIRKIFQDRGETQFSGLLAEANNPNYRGTRRLPRRKTWGLGQSPWRAAQNLADDIDKQLFYRGNGTLMLRELPTTPDWVFEFGANSTLTERPEERISILDFYNYFVVRGQKSVKGLVRTNTELKEAASAGDNVIKVKSITDFEIGRRVEIGGRANNPEVRTITDIGGGSAHNVTLGSGLDRAHGIGAPVSVRFRGEKTVRVVGRSQIERTHPLSAFVLSNWLRPLIKIDDRDRIHSKVKARQKAEAESQRAKRGLENEIAITTVPIPHLEICDLVKLKGDFDKVFRLRRIDLSLPSDGTMGSMSINYIGDNRPYATKRQYRRARRRRRRRWRNRND